MLVKCALVLFCISSVFCDRTEEPRSAKIFSFEGTKGDFEVGLDFSLPFLKIPVKSPVDPGTPYAHHGLDFPKINVNLSSLFVGGLILFITTVISPLLSKTHGINPWDRSSRVSDNEADYNPLLDFSHEMLIKNRGCLERIACTSSQHLHDINSLRSMKLIMRNNLLSSILNTTALEEAADHGLQGSDCDKFGPCSLGAEDFIRVLNNLAGIKKRK
ncbi:uncharacterized protein LOC123699851 [Colias croceus]|uniref:uncharacterized protein LOC123699851 n=1 Tax=Colias crocea TaxID=72248 RepID=UPI001E27E3FD|nr:uncharacterized protein LOC123699851 [Colias croceus]